MKILPDECLPLDFRHSFPGHEAHTVQWAGLKGIKNGELLAFAAMAGYAAIVTVGRGPERCSFGLKVLLVRRFQAINKLGIQPGIDRTPCGSPAEDEELLLLGFRFLVARIFCFARAGKRGGARILRLSGGIAG